MVTFTPVAISPAHQALQETRSTFAFKVLLLFSFLYYARPEDLVPGSAYVPIGKIVGGLALLAMVFGAGKIKLSKIPAEIRLLFALFIWLSLTIPFAWWKGGAFDTVYGKFSKGVIIALMVTVLVTRISELRKLLFVQVASIALVTIASMAVNHNLRMQGALGGIYENPNDLAINIALNWPIAFAFLLLAKGPVKKAIWAVAMLVMLLGVFLTYSRGGLLALLLAFVVCLWQFGIKGKRIHVLAGAVAAIVLAVAIAPFAGLSPSYWIGRMSTIVSSSSDDSYDNGSKQAREELFDKSVGFMKSHPVFGIGPGNFESLSGSWRVAHNSYTELGAEAGIPALLLFVFVLICAFRNLGGASQSHVGDRETDIFTGAMWASLAAFVLGAIFSSMEYELFPYFLVAYTSVLYKLTRTGESATETVAPSLSPTQNRFAAMRETRQPALASSTRISPGRARKL